jgi:hypothetical protein
MVARIVKDLALGSRDHLNDIVAHHKLRRGRAVPAEIARDLLARAANRQKDAAVAAADAQRLMDLAMDVQTGAVELPEPPALDAICRQRRADFMGSTKG